VNHDEMKTGPVIGAGLAADGISIQAPSPLGDLWFPMTWGMTVLYGRNGAGKSRLLDAIGSALRGYRVDQSLIALHLSLAPAEDAWGRALLDRLVDAIKDREVVEATEPSEAGGAIEVAGQVARLERHLEAMSKPYSGWMTNPRIALVAVGTEETGWCPCLSMELSEPATFAANLSSFMHAVGEDEIERLRSQPEPFFMLPFSVPHLLDGDFGHVDPAMPIIVAPLYVKRIRDLVTLFERPDEFVTLRERPDVLIADEHIDVQQRSLRAIMQDESGTPQLIDRLEGTQLHVSETIATRLAALSTMATRMLRVMTGFQTDLQVSVTHPSSWSADVRSSGPQPMMWDG
jgi:hypothetical protein